MAGQTASERMRQRTAELSSKASPPSKPRGSRASPHVPAVLPSSSSQGLRTRGGFSGDTARELTSEVSTLQQDLDRRLDSYGRRENEYLNRIEHLALQLEQTTGRADPEELAASTVERFDSLKDMHREIMSNLEVVDKATVQILQDQERDLLRAFRARLFDVQTELDREKAKKDESAATWIQRSKQLEAELDWAREMAGRLKRINQQLSVENKDYKEKFQAGEEDRDYLIKQLVAVKKDNTKLQQETDRVTREFADLEDKRKSNNLPFARKSTISGKLKGDTRPLSARYEDSKAKRLDEIKRLKRLLEGQQRSLRTARNTYAMELNRRTELQRLLKQCLLDIRQQIQARRHNPNYGGDKTAHVLSRLRGQQIPEKSLSLLESQDRVVSMLYNKAFPIQHRGGQVASQEDIQSLEVDEEAIRQLLQDRPRTSTGLLPEVGVGAVGSGEGTTHQ